MTDMFPDLSGIRKPDVLPHEEVLRLFVKQEHAGYKDGWLYHKCKEKGLLAIYNEFQSRDIFKLLRSDAGDKLFTPKLTIELVPKTCWFSNVRSNVTAYRWNKLRKEQAQKANYECQICGGKGPKWPVECHEIWEYDDNTLVQKLKGLISLCPDCHSAKHMGFTQLCERESEITCHLAIVNGWSYKFACEYIAEQFEVWQERSKYSWLLDISWLEKHGISIENQSNPKSLYKNLKKSRAEYFLNNRKVAADHYHAGQDYEKQQNYQKACDEYLIAIDFGSFDAAFNLAEMYLSGSLGKKNYSKLRKHWYYIKKAACLGDKDAIAIVKEGWDRDADRKHYKEIEQMQYTQTTHCSEDNKPNAKINETKKTSDIKIIEPQNTIKYSANILTRIIEKIKWYVK